MKYIRKTQDIWEIQANYGQGWEFECAEFSWKQAKVRLKEYRENAPKYPVRSVKKREPLDEYLAEMKVIPSEVV